jgi:hypothetical protein
MVRLLLPFSMGKEVRTKDKWVDFEYEHPILIIGSSYSSIKQPILEWLVDTYGTDVKTGFDGNEYYIDFPTEADITWFKLRWLS